MRFASRFGMAFSLLLSTHPAEAQKQPATIPTVVAQAMSFEPEMFGRPQFFDGRTPTDWPRELVPPGTTIIGGGIVGDSAMFRMQTVVFEFPARSKPSEVMRTVFAQAGYTRHDATPRGSGGGFVATERSASATRYCKGSSMAGFSVVDSVQTPLLIAVALIDGEAGRQNCNQSDRPMHESFPVLVPNLSPPSGVMQFGGGSGWGGSEGYTSSTLRTTMPADSVLSHYAAQLVAGGWTAKGRPTVGNGAGLQRFSFRQGEEAWEAILFVVAMGERRQIQLHLAKAD